MSRPSFSWRAPQRDHKDTAQISKSHRSWTQCEKGTKGQRVQRNDGQLAALSSVFSRLKPVVLLMGYAHPMWATGIHQLCRKIPLTRRQISLYIGISDGKTRQ